MTVNMHSVAIQLAVLKIRKVAKELDEVHLTCGYEVVDGRHAFEHTDEWSGVKRDGIQIGPHRHVGTRHRRLGPVYVPGLPVDCLAGLYKCELFIPRHGIAHDLGVAIFRVALVCVAADLLSGSDEEPSVDLLTDLEWKLGE